MFHKYVRSCGDNAWRTLRNHRQARVQGSISKGIFLLFPERKIVFISYQPFQGPLNLTLEEPLAHTPLPAQTEDEVLVTEDEIFFPSARITLHLHRAHLWKAPSPPKQSDNGKERLQALARLIYAARPVDGWSAMLPHLLGWEDAPELPEALRPPLACLMDAREALRVGQTDTALAPLSRIIGLGRGLTPSGDDCLSGMLLMRARGRFASQGSDALAKALVAATYTRSTAISANILEAAAEGAAEERLLAACDGILTGRGELSAVVEGLMGYGSSSGIDALLGMAVALE